MMGRLFGIVCLFLVSLQCTAGGAPSLESLILKSLKRGEISVMVKSHGCTQAEDFQVTVQGQDISIVRNKPDRCRRMPFWQELNLTFSVTPAVQNLVLLNPLVLSD